MFWRRLVLLELLAGLDPAGDAGGQVLHVFEAQSLGGGSATLVGFAGRATAVSHHEGALVGLGQLLGEVVFVLEGNGARDVAALGEGLRAIHVDHDNLASLDGLVEVSDADVGVLTGLPAALKTEVLKRLHASLTAGAPHGKHLPVAEKQVIHQILTVTFPHYIKAAAVR